MGDWLARCQNRANEVVQEVAECRLLREVHLTLSLILASQHAHLLPRLEVVACHRAALNRLFE